MYYIIFIDTLTSVNELVVHTSINIINQTDRGTFCKFSFLFNLILKGVHKKRAMYLFSVFLFVCFCFTLKS